MIEVSPCNMLAFVRQMFPSRTLTTEDIRAMMRIVVEGWPLDINREPADRFAIADGFGGPLTVTVKGRERDLDEMFSDVPGDVPRPIERLLVYWLLVHGPVLFEGTLIMWEDR